MAVLGNKNYHKRAVFPKGLQRKFLNTLQNLLGASLQELAKTANTSRRTMSDWKRERYSMSLSGLEKLCRKAKIQLPKSIVIKDPFWYTHIGSYAGGIAVFKKYGRIGGDPEYRKKKWCEWWEREGKFKKHPIINTSLPFHTPHKSPELAEFIGILLGDGGLTSKQITVTLNKFDDIKFIPYVTTLIQKLFKLAPSIYQRRGEKVVNIVISRSKLVRYLVSMGLKIGGKVRQQVDVPDWIKRSNSYIKPCLRGLFDTDGCFYIDRHSYNDKIYLNSAMNFTNRSNPLLAFFKINLERFGFHPTQKTKFSIFLRKENEIIKYFKEIGSSNPKHFDKFKEYLKTRYGEVPKWS